MKNRRLYDLEDRLIEYAVQVSRFSEKLPQSRIGNYLANQLIRSGASPALNYGEAQAAESKKDFVHKLKIILKELRESQICLKIIEKRRLVQMQDVNRSLLIETGELIAIMLAIIKTTQSKMKSKSPESNDLNQN